MGTYGGGQKRENNGFSKISEFAFFSEFQMRGSDGRIGFVNAKRKTKFGCPYLAVVEIKPKYYHQRPDSNYSFSNNF